MLNVIDKGIDPKDPSKCIIEIEGTQEEMDALMQKVKESGKTLDDWFVDIMQKGIEEMKAKKEKGERLVITEVDEEANENKTEGNDGT